MNSEHHNSHSIRSLRDDSVNGVDYGRSSAQRLSFAGSTVELEEAGTLARGSIDHVKTGSALYKYTSHGTSLKHRWHSRLFQVKGDGASLALTWRRDSMIDFRKERAVLFVHMNELRFGVNNISSQHPGFGGKSQAWCFTVVYTVPPSPENCHLYLCAKTDLEFKTWKRGLQALYTRSASHRDALLLQHNWGSPRSGEGGGAEGGGGGGGETSTTRTSPTLSYLHRSPTTEDKSASATRSHASLHPSPSEGGEPQGRPPARTPPPVPDAFAQQGVGRAGSSSSSSIPQKRASKAPSVASSSKEEREREEEQRRISKGLGAPAGAEPRDKDKEKERGEREREGLPAPPSTLPPPPQRSLSPDRKAGLHDSSPPSGLSTNDNSRANSLSLHHPEPDLLGRDHSALQPSEQGSERKSGGSGSWTRAAAARKEEDPSILKLRISKLKKEWKERQGALQSSADARAADLETEIAQVEELSVSLAHLDLLKVKIRERSLELGVSIKRLNALINEREVAVGREAPGRPPRKQHKLQETMAEATKLIDGNTTGLKKINDMRTTIDKQLDMVPIPGPPSRLGALAGRCLNVSLLAALLFLLLFLLAFLPLRALSKWLPRSSWPRLPLLDSPLLHGWCEAGPPACAPWLRHPMAVLCAALQPPPPPLCPWLPPSPWQALAAPFLHLHPSLAPPDHLLNWEAAACLDPRCSELEGNWARAALRPPYPYTARWWD